MTYRSIVATRRGSLAGVRIVENALREPSVPGCPRARKSRRSLSDQVVRSDFAEANPSRL